MRCKDCDALRIPAVHAPHRSLSLERAAWHPEGYLEHYRCLQCSSRWSWLIARDGASPLKVVPLDDLPAEPQVVELSLQLSASR